MEHLDTLENKSIYLIREAYYRFKGDIAMLWSMGKDSTTLLWLMRKAFFGKIPFPVIHIDTSYKFPEMYAFRDRLAKEWGLPIIVAKNETKLGEGWGPLKTTKLDCCTELKTNALKEAVRKHGVKALYLGIRRDEHGIRAKERYFSPRTADFQWEYENQPAEIWDHYQSQLDQEEHFRIHPILHFTELDIWEYIRREGIPVTDLYFARDGKRYRSIGCAPCCSPVESQATTVDQIIEELKKTHESERAGRGQDKESLYTMQKLRSLGYM